MVLIHLLQTLKLLIKSTIASGNVLFAFLSLLLLILQVLTFFHFIFQGTPYTTQLTEFITFNITVFTPNIITSHILLTVIT